MEFLEDEVLKEKRVMQERLEIFSPSKKQSLNSLFNRSMMVQLVLKESLDVTENQVVQVAEDLRVSEVFSIKILLVSSTFINFLLLCKPKVRLAAWEILEKKEKRADQVSLASKEEMVAEAYQEHQE